MTNDQGAILIVLTLATNFMLLFIMIAVVCCDSRLNRVVNLLRNKK